MKGIYKFFLEADIHYLEGLFIIEKQFVDYFNDNELKVLYDVTEYEEIELTLDKNCFKFISTNQADVEWFKKLELEVGVNAFEFTYDCDYKVIEFIQEQLGLDSLENKD